ncbi:usherin [Callorhinus ursinus]|uniref:Usherin n=1 Tax=Callorhinus ursinus TaxID=34884 RepID=A0A3Q7QQU6_CALUR|nr:usherin-like [Callorhinus ursinus]
MHCLALSLGFRFLTHIPETLLFAYFAAISLADSQGLFPRLENVGAFKNVSLVPTQATCGLPDRSTFCHSSAVATGLGFCTQRLCIQDCPYRSSPAVYTALFSTGLGSCVTIDKHDLCPNCQSNSTSFIFGNHKNCFSSPPSPRLAASFTLAVWLKPERGSVMCVIEKTADGQIVFKLTISEKETMFYYRTVNGLQPPIKVMTLGRILVKEWIHLSVQVHQTKISFFINGLEEDNTAFDARTLSGSITDFASGTTQIGQSLNGLEQFVGRMQDFRLYQVALTNREILEIFSGDLFRLHIQSHCRCPGSHPRVHPLGQRYCIPNDAEDTTTDRVLRLNPEAHPLSFVNDNDIGTSWVSQVFTNITQLHQGVTISIDLENGQYQVFYIIIQFLSPQPTAIRIQRKKEDSLDWEDWQFFARNCRAFGMENNGKLENPDSVNCLQLSTFTPYSHGNVTFSILTPGPNHRPGYNDFYNTPSLQEFVKATQIRLHFQGQYYTTETPVSLRHRYYAVDEITITGRCQCYGHADKCDTTSQPYRCLCSLESFTQGLHCDHCLPLYNDKPFRQGDQVHAFNCKPCQCNNHSRSCHYNISVDPFPFEHHKGGGGVCDDCEHNTTGRNCELCKDYFFRPVGADPSAMDVCKPCDCDKVGTRNSGFLCDKIGGQCNCKRHVSGRQCNQCQNGFYNLQESDPDGCSSCNCSTSGTVDGDTTCHPNSGQCKCKANVIGLRCDHCNFGFKFLRSFNDDGCEPCRCNLHGSVNKLCNPLSGQCECKKEAKGLQCDTCREHFYGLDITSCKACDCDMAGSLSGTICDAKTGQCICKPRVGGRRCNECLEGYFYLQQNNSFLCLPCNCDKAGTVNGSLLCDKSTGQCPCKLGVTGLHCNQCAPHRYNLTSGNSQGCQMCECDSLGTLPGITCDPISGQCLCLPNRQGRRCNQCQSGFYISPGNAPGCLPCSCHVTGAVHHICNSLTGQCICQDVSIAGQSCDHCRDLYFGFDPQTGRCQPCNCHLSGALNETCHLVTGQCFCKRFVTGSKCDTCVPSASHLDVNNPLGCSKTPSQQPPPRGQVQSSSAINLSWSPPDSPNAHWLTYSLFRDSSEIYTTEDQYPYNIQYFLDTDLLPYTSYSYYIETASVHGSTRSESVTYKTKPGVPEGNLNLHYILPISSDSVTLAWTAPSNRSGPIEKYILSCAPSSSNQPCVSYEGYETSTTIRNLVPFTKYHFSVQACTSGGCLHSSPLTVITAQAPPQRLGPPEVRNIGSTELHVEWSPPMEPNGIIIRYELYMKRMKSDGENTSAESRVFQSSGWLSPHPLAESANENALKPPQTATTITALEPYTKYEFRVLAVNMAGSVSSAWTSERTGESVPVFMSPPSVFPLSPHSLNVSWEKPAENVTRGEVVGYKINMVSEQSPRQSLPAALSQVLYTAKSQELSYIVKELKPYRIYNFTISLCNSIGCVTSASGTGQTLAAAPTQLRPPVVEGINSTTIRVRWLPPEELNGPSPVYQLERRESSLPAPTAMMMKGIRFIGNGYYKFPSSTHPVNTDFTGKCILTGLLPFKNYAVTLTACTLAGCTESSQALNISTPQEAPQEVQPPVAKSLPNSLLLSWNPPKKTNGIITQYSLYMDGMLIYSGSGRNYTATDLAVFTPHQFVLGACTHVGCTNSSLVILYTAQLPPERVDSPLLTVLDSRTIYVQWKQPRNVNGILERYILYISNHTHDFTIWDVIYNSTELFQDHLLQYLSPGNKYLIKLGACTGGGCTVSEASEALTDEQAPEGVPTPKAHSYSPHSFHISWTEPEHPNGVITSYGLYLDGVLIHNSSELSCHAYGFAPWSLHSFRVQACTAKGCALGPLVENRTLEAPPEGTVNVFVKTEGSREAHVRWDAPFHPNGRLTYSVLFTGIFYADQADNNYTLLNGTQVMHRGEETNRWVLIKGLVPFTNYTVQVNVSNSQGSLMSDPVTFAMPPGAPDGVLPPRLSSATPTSLQVVWFTPARNNAPGSPRYQLQMRPGHSTHGFLELFSNPSASLSYEVRDLQPYTEYEFRLVASNGFGSAHSSWILFVTTEDKPGPMDPPILLDVKSRMMLVTWQHPLKCNGVITHYNIYQHGHLSLKTSGNVTNCTVIHLRPYTAYKFQVEACTSKGCSLSPESQTIWTLPDAPEDIPSPELFSDTPTSVIISWQPPKHPNGLVENFTIDRRVQGEEEFTTLVTLPRSHSMRFIDKTSALSPWTKYEYRVLMSTLNGGTNSSAWVEVTTRPSRPAGVQPPKVHVLGPDTAEVTWKPPLMQNGDILSYEIRMPDPHLTITNVTSSVLSQVITHLIPFTNYSVTIVACSGGNGYLGGCTESLPTHVTTHPTLPQGINPLLAIPLSESYVGISWQPPSRPNGPDLRYELLRRKIQQPLASNPPEDLNLWHNIYSGTQWFYEDKGLSRFTTYEYKVFVHNSVGFSPSQGATVTTLAGLPERGANLTVTVVNHTAIDVTWAKPTFQDLQGDVEYYTLFWSSATSNESLKILPDVNSHVISHLNPNTEYQIFISVFNGVHSISGEVLRATTFDGEPQGMLPPEVVIINSTAVCVIWTSPSNPNGVVTEYSVYVNNKLYKTGMNVPGSFILRDLSPFTIYDIQVEVCTKYACVKSNGTQITTVEDTPSDIPTPTIHGITSRSLQVDWMSPGKPNGIILGYDVLRRTWHSCPKTQKLRKDHSGELCKAVKCQKPKTICGERCYSPEAQVCCNGVLYDPQPGHHCCEEKYIPFILNSTVVCCGGRIREAQPNHHCCSGYYTRILPGEVCCPDEQHNRVSTGIGDSCCGRMPYSTSGNQICCAGRLHDGHGQQCCGGQIVSKDLECCGGEEEGMAYSRLPGMFCCGQDYVNMSDTICCSASSGESKAHVKKNDPVPIKCCETELIPKSQKCCNGVGYNPLKYVCSDKISTGMMMKETRECGTVCPASLEATAYCGRCDFNFTSHVCTVIRGPHNSTGKESIEEICSSAEETVHTGSVNTFSFTDVNLEPYMAYEYRISAWNSYGRGFSKAIRARTKEDVPEGVSAPRWTKMDNFEDVIVLNWKKPIQSNGPIVYYILLRNGIECFRGTSLSFSDTEGIWPFQEYSYQLKACTVAGCAISSKVVASTTQGVPESILPPRVTAPSAEALHLSWSVPEKPNGIIKEYQLRQVGKGLIYTGTTDRRQHTVTGLQPYTNYSFTLTACTSAGCTSSEPFLGQTLQAAPEGVWVTPRHIIINSTTVELFWSPPEKPNGLISQYQLSRNGTLVFLGDSEEQNFTDKNLEPNSRYIYKLEATTGGGSNPSDDYIVQTPVLTPEEIQPPYNITVIGPYSIFVAWTPPGILIPKMPVEYNVLLNAGSVAPLTSSVGHHQCLLLENLAPFTQYEIRIQACQNGSCGVSSRTFVKTSEAAPVDLHPPVLKALGSACIEVKWMPPEKPNGVIINYFLHRRSAGIEEESLLFVWSEGALEFTDASDTLRPFTLYEYRVRAHNSRGSVESLWSSARTLEAPPQSLLAPWAQATSAHSVLLNWTKPELPNGIISQYHVVYQERLDDPTFNVSTVHAFTVMGMSLQAHLFGLEPFTTYHVGIVATNQAGEVSSPWTVVQTLESSPSGLSNFTVQQQENGRALLLQWSEPVRTNGVIKTYNIFSEGILEYTGLNRQFLFRRLVPFTLYTLTLEACTKVGCAHSEPQPLWTDEAPPHSQLAPAIQAVGSTSIELSWSEPLHPHGKIIRYDVIRRCFEGKAWGNQTIQADEKIVFTEYNTERNTFMYNDTDLQPWTQCGYKIHTWNSAGHTCSSWNIVRTKQAPPEGLSPPEVACVSVNPPKLLISWIPPEQSNGIIQSYKLQRNGVLYPFSFDAVTFNYTDEDLLPFSTYSYAVIACSDGGCSTSKTTSFTTPEAAPAGVSPPALWTINSTQINVSWAPPLIQNGKITKYLLRLDGKEYLAGQSLSLLVSDLQPYTQYNFSLEACTNGGCTTSASKSAWTMEAPPQSMDPPKLQVTGSESIEITWKPPRKPNGQIRSYELRRDGTIVYTGLETRYHDFTLTPGVEYGYTVTANNSQGGILSPLIKDRTSPSAPSGIEPPKLKAKGPQQILVNWDAPVRTNGDIVNYTLFIRGLFEKETKIIHIDTTHSSFDTRSFVVDQLKPFHRYEVRVQACTMLGCASSDWTSLQTPEVAPLMQPPPHLEVRMAPGGFQPTVTLSWMGPLQPNGKVLYYELYRRQIATRPGKSNPVLTYNGSSSSFTDFELSPFTEYEYQVWAVNSAGKAPSTWTWCRTGPAPPEGLGAPTFHAVSSTQAVVNISAPGKPNGIVILYRLFSNASGAETVLSEGMATQQTLHGLQPFTTYSVGVEACTCFNCCSKGPTAELRTHPAPPSGLSSPQIQTLSSRTGSFRWSPPLFPNGVIQSYELQLYAACPPDLATLCAPGQAETKYVGLGLTASLEGLQPYTTYKLRVVAHNEVGSMASGWISFITQTELPQYRGPFLVDSNLSLVRVDWSGSFLLNGPLKEFVVTDGGQRVYSGFDTTLYLPRTADKTFFFQVICTTDEGSVKTPVVQYDTSTGFGLVLTTPEEKRGLGSKSTEFYSELWFIVLMAILGLILLAIFLSLILQRKIHKEPYIRERPPLVPIQKRMSPLSVYPPGETHVGLADTKIPRSGTPISIRSNRSISVLRVPSQSQISQTYSQGSLPLSVSQLMDIQDKKVLIDDSLWETIMGHDSGLYVDEEDLMNAIKGFSSVTKEHTTFTDTQL